MLSLDPTAKTLNLNLATEQVDNPFFLPALYFTPSSGYRHAHLMIRC
jgi:hypothetical protein